MFLLLWTLARAIFGTDTLTGHHEINFYPANHSKGVTKTTFPVLSTRAAILFTWTAIVVTLTNISSMRVTKTS